MSTVAKPLPFGFVPPPFPRPQVELISEDGIPVDHPWQRYAFNLLDESVRQHFRDRDDFYSGADMFIYFSEQQARNRDFCGPDFFFVWGRPPLPLRPYWAIWDEDWHFPNVIIELLSDSTRKDDLGIKKEVYQDIFKTEDYFCYDFATGELFGWTLSSGEYVELEPNDRGWMWSEQLGLWVGAARGVYLGFEDVWLRFFTPDGQLLQSFAEAAAAHAERETNRADGEASRAEREASRAEREASRAEREASRAEREASRAEREAKRAKDAEAELARLKAELAARDKPQS